MKKNKGRYLIVAAALLVGLTLAVLLTVSASAEYTSSQNARRLALTSVCSGSYCMDWDVLAGGLGEMSSTNYTVNATLGQTMAASFSSSSYQLQTGFWARVNQMWRVFLPMIANG